MTAVEPQEPTGSAGRFTAPVTLAGLAGLNLAVAFGYQWLPIVRYGAGAETDALFVSAVVPQIILSIVSGSLVSVLTPMLATVDPLRFRVQTWTFAQAVGAVAIAIHAVLFLLAPYWVGWMAPGFDAGNTLLAVRLVRVQLLGAVGTMVLMVSWAAYYARHRFVWVEVSGCLAGTAGLAVAWWGMPGAGVAAFAWGMAIRTLLQVVLLLPGLGRYARPDWHAADGWTMWRRMVPLLGGATYYKLDPLVERLLASFAPAGHLSLFHLAQQVYAAGNSILTKALVNPALPTMARLAADRAWPAFEALGRRRLALVVALSAAAWLPLVLVGRPVLASVLGSWLPPDEIALLHAVLVALVGVWLGGAAGQMLTAGFFAIGETRTPTLVGVVGFTVAIPLKAVGFAGWGIVGLSVATSVYTAGNAVAHRLLLQRRLRRHAGASPRVRP